MNSVAMVLHLRFTLVFRLQNWSPDIYLSWGCGQGIQHSNSVSLCREASEDISIKMKRRAQRGYGLDVGGDCESRLSLRVSFVATAMM